MSTTVQEATAALERLRIDPKASAVEVLNPLLEQTRKAWLDGSHDAVARIAEVVANAARDESLRLPVGESGILGFFLDSVISADELGEDLKKQSLRLIGNACAECDENKARVVESGKLSRTLIDFLDDDDSLFPFSVSVLFNICVDNEAAQLQVCQACLSRKLVKLISTPRLHRYLPSLNLIIQLFEQLVALDAEPENANLSTPAVLLRVATDKSLELDLEDFTGLCRVALTYLSYEKFQTALVAERTFAVLQNALEESCHRFVHPDVDPDGAEELKRIWHTSMTILADMSSLESFKDNYPIDNPEVQLLVAWLRTSPSYSHLQTAACLCLGNLSRSDASSVALVGQVLGPLLAILSRAVRHDAGDSIPVAERPPPQLLHAVLGFIRNLAIPAVNKPRLSTSLLGTPGDILPQLWTSTTAQPQVQFASVSLARQLLINNPTAARLLCAPLKPTQSQSTYTTRDGPAHSNLHILLDVAQRADAESIKMEAGRAACAIIRHLQSDSDSSSPEEKVLDESWTWSSFSSSSPDTPDTSPATAKATAHFYTAHTAHTDPLAKTLTSLLTQKKFPPLTSEALYVLALLSRSMSMSSTSSSARTIITQVLQSEDVSRTLTSAILGPEREITQDELAKATQATDGEDDEARLLDERLKSIDELGLEPQGGGGGGKQKQTAVPFVQADRVNGLIIVAEVVRRRSEMEELTPVQRRTYEVLLREGSALVAARKELDSE
ncbi:hypothetical protein QBC47DRAFT_385973 [Echria macrotheca]|uniref:Uncharacterized protein n=1 Tax=Echria macrotheca TaxID=438768 RepID=A0AAJ0F573_9PEZI|nr:hypothetical protein QBC47DRAFT_385973 [Echria macrotheca]